VMTPKQALAIYHSGKEAVVNGHLRVVGPGRTIEIESQFSGA